MAKKTTTPDPNNLPKYIKDIVKNISIVATEQGVAMPEFKKMANNEKANISEAYAQFTDIVNNGSPENKTPVRIPYEYSNKFREWYLNNIAIANQYAGKSAEDVWNAWTESQRSHFLLDHSELLDNDRDENNLGHSRTAQKDKSYAELTPHTKRVLEAHVEGGSYEKGGSLPGKIRIIEDEVTFRKDEPRRIYHKVTGVYKDYYFRSETNTDSINQHKKFINSINNGAVTKLEIDKLSFNPDSVVSIINRMDYPEFEANTIALFEDTRWRIRKINAGANKEAFETIMHHLESLALSKGSQKREYAKGGPLTGKQTVTKAKKQWDKWNITERQDWLSKTFPLMDLGHLQSASVNGSERLSDVERSIFVALMKHVGGEVSVPNNYVGKSAEQIWDAWDYNQRKHFLMDHELDGIKEGMRGIDRDHRLNSKYNDLPDEIKWAIRDHLEQGQYKTGGPLPSSTLDFDKDGNLATTIGNDTYTIIYKDDTSKLYELFKNGDLIAANQNIYLLKKVIDNNADQYVPVSETTDGYWFIIGKPTHQKSQAQKVVDLGVPDGETGKVVALSEALTHDKVIGREYLQQDDTFESGGPATGSVKEDIKIFPFSRPETYDVAETVVVHYNSGSPIVTKVKTIDGNGLYTMENDGQYHFSEIVPTKLKYATGGKLDEVNTPEEFKEWTIGRNMELIDSVGDFKVGDEVMFTNEAGITFGPYNIIGIEKDDSFYGRQIYLNKDSYWFPVRPDELKHTKDTFATGGPLSSIETDIKAALEILKENKDADEFGDITNPIFERLKNEFAWDHEYDTEAHEYLLNATSEESLQYLLDTVLPNLEKSPSTMQTILQGLNLQPFSAEVRAEITAMLQNPVISKLPATNPKVQKLIKKLKDKYPLAFEAAYTKEELENAIMGYQILADDGDKEAEAKITELKAILENVDKFEDGGPVETMDLYYVTDINGHVKNISKTEDAADTFLRTALKNAGDVNFKSVLKSDWDREKISVSNIKTYKFSNGGPLSAEERERYQFLNQKLETLQGEYMDLEDEDISATELAEKKKALAYDINKIEFQIHKIERKDEFFAKGGKLGDEVTFAQGLGYWDVTRYPYGGDFKRLKGGEKGTLIEGTVKIGGEMRVKLADGRTIVVGYQGIDLPDNDAKYEVFERNKHLWSFGFATGGPTNEDWRTEKLDGFEWEVKYLMPDAKKPEIVGGFETEKEARDWAKNKIGAKKSIILEAKEFEVYRIKNDKNGNSPTLPKDGSSIKVHMPKMGDFPAKDITLKYDQKNFTFNIFDESGKKVASMGERAVLDNIDNNLYVLQSDNNITPSRDNKVEVYGYMHPTEVDDKPLYITKKGFLWKVTKDTEEAHGFTSEEEIEKAIKGLDKKYSHIEWVKQHCEFEKINTKFKKGGLLGTASSGKKIFDWTANNSVTGTEGWHYDFMERTKGFTKQDYIDAAEIFGKENEKWGEIWQKAYDSVTPDEWNDDNNAKGQEAYKKTKEATKNQHKYGKFWEWAEKAAHPEKYGKYKKGGPTKSSLKIGDIYHLPGSDRHYTVIIDKGEFGQYSYVSDEKGKPNAKTYIIHSNSRFDETPVKVGSISLEKIAKKIGGTEYAYFITGDKNTDIELSQFDDRWKSFAANSTKEERAKYDEQEDHNNHWANANMLDKWFNDQKGNTTPFKKTPDANKSRYHKKKIVKTRHGASPVTKAKSSAKSTFKKTK